MDNVQLQFDDEAIQHRPGSPSTQDRRRALRGIVEELMLDLMYDLPSQSEVKSFTVTKAMVEQHTGANVLALPDSSQQKSA